MKQFLAEPLAAVFLTLLIFILCRRLYLRYHFFLFNPLLLAAAVIIAFLYIAEIPFETYNRGGKAITFFLGPATVALALPLYRLRHEVKKDLLPTLGGTFAGALVGILSMQFLARLFRLSPLSARSLVVKSATMPIALGISEQLHGHPSLTVLGVVVAGVFGGLLGPEILRLFRVKDPAATGLGIGAASHAGGTSRAIQIGEKEGSMSGVAIVLTGLWTAVIIKALQMLHLI